MRQQANEAMLVEIRAAYKNSRKTNGCPRIHAYLRRKGHFCGRNRVARLMKQHQIVVRKAHGSYPVITRACPSARTAPILLNCEFSSLSPNQKWGCDITYICTEEGWLYLAVIIELYSRKIVGWAIGEQID